MYQTLSLAKKLRFILTRILKMPNSCRAFSRNSWRPGKTGPEWRKRPSRPESVEAEGTHHFATFLENTGAAGYVVHLSVHRH